MLKISDRVRPCRARFWRLSSGRVTLSALPPSASLTTMAGCGANSSLPLGPSTRTLPSATWTLTPAGTTTGCLPIRDMIRTPVTPLAEAASGDLLPHLAEQFAADALGAGLAIADDAAVGAQNRDAQAFQHGLQFLVAAINPQPRPAGALQVTNHALPFRTVLEEDSQDLLRFLVVGRRLEGALTLLVRDHGADLKLDDETFVLEHLGDLLL